MTDHDLIVAMFSLMIFYITYSAWQIASIRDEVRQILKQLKEQKWEQRQRLSKESKL